MKENPVTDLSNETVTGYAALAYNTWQQARGVPGASTWDALPETVRAGWVTTVRAVLDAATPVIRAQEREACASLADEYAAVRFTGNLADGVERLYFADLLRERA